MANLFHLRTRVELERHRRILVSVWAYAYEFESVSLVSDARFDQVCYLINPAIETGRPLLDDFFKRQFQPDTGMWIHHHPELDKVRRLYETHYSIPATSHRVRSTPGQ